VEALQRQLAQLEELEGEMEHSSRQTGLAVAAMGHVVSMSNYRKVRTSSRYLAPI
jgi:hypothetical protein